MKFVHYARSSDMVTGFASSSMVTCLDKQHQPPTPAAAISGSKTPARAGGERW